MTQAVNRIPECYSPTHTVPLGVRRVMAVHRCGLGDTAAQIALAYRGGCPEAAKATGGRMPYHLVILPNGIIEQAAPLDAVTPHARSWNHVAIGVAVIGDFRNETPSIEQWDALRKLAHTCSGWLGGRLAVKGHDELAEARADKSKGCPGKGLDMEALRAEILEADTVRVVCRYGIRMSEAK
jgi:hypothetical protein